MLDKPQLSEAILRKLEARAIDEGCSVDELVETLLDTPADIQDRYETLFKLPNNAILTVKTNQGVIIDANPIAAMILGYSREELLTLHGTDIVAPDKAEQTFAQWERQLQETGSFSVETVWLHKDGTRIPMLVSGKPFVNRDDEEIYQLIGQDIRPIIQIEQARRESEARYRTLVEHFPNGLIALYDHNLRYVVASGLGSGNSNISPKDLEGKRLRDIFPPEVYERDEPALLASLRGETIESIVEFNGGHFRVITTPVRDENDTITGGMVVTQDITELKQAQEQLTTVNAQLSVAMDTAELGIWEFHIATDTLTTNAKMFDLYGIDPTQDNITDIRLWQSYVHPDDIEASRERIVQMSQNGLTQSPPFRIYRDKQDLRYIRAFGRAIRDADSNIEKFIGVNFDVTDIIEAQQKLATSEARLISLIETHSAYVIRTDIEGYYTYANPIFFKHFASHRYDSVTEMLGTFSLEMIIPEDHDKTYETVRQCMEKPGQPVQLTMRKPRATGEIVHTVWEFVAIPDEDGDVQELQCIGIDIIELIHTQNKLQTSQKRLETILHSISDYVWSADVDDNDIRYTFYSPVIEDMTGYPPEYFMQNMDAWLDTIHIDDRARVQSGVERELNGEQVVHEYRIVRKDGEIRWHYGKTSPTFDDNGQLVRLDGVVSDITERKQVELALQESENRYRTLFNGTQNPIVIYDRDARIVMLNDVAAQNLQTTSDDAVGKKLGDFFPTNQLRTEKRIARALKEKQPFTVEDKIILLDGSVRWFWSIVQALPSISGQPELVQIFSYDVTERKQAEAAQAEHEERFRAAIDASLDAFYLMESVRDDAGEIYDFRIIEINDNASIQMGLSREELVGGLICELFPINRIAGFFDRYKQVAETGEPLDQEFTIPNDQPGSGWYQH